jgi:hypothetical protein
LGSADWSRPIVVGLSLLLGAGASAQVPHGGTGTVAGRVFCSDTQTPCRFASVNLQTAPSDKPMVRQAQVYRAATDITGSFEITGVAEGEYMIQARLPGYLCPYDILRVDYEVDQTPPDSLLRKTLAFVSVGAGQTANTTLTLARGAALGGTVRYDDGAPVIGAAMHLFRKGSGGEWKKYTNTAGDESLAPLGLGSHTDDRGRFYEPSLPPGHYKVMVNLPEALLLPATITGRSEMHVTFAGGSALRVFNGGKFRMREADGIELHEGEDRMDVDMVVPTTGLRTVRGVVVRQVDQSAVKSGTVSLRDPEDKSLLRSTEIKEDGSFDFEYVPDGTYVIEVNPESLDGIVGVSLPLVVAGDLSDLSYGLKKAAKVN